jgi:hypothetical protein
MNQHSYAHLIFDKALKIYDGEKIASSTNVGGKSGYLSSKNCGSRTLISDLKL